MAPDPPISATTAPCTICSLIGRLTAHSFFSQVPATIAVVEPTSSPCRRQRNFLQDLLGWPPRVSSNSRPTESPPIQAGQVKLLQPAPSTVFAQVPSLSRPDLIHWALKFAGVFA